ncbi:MAG: SDR family oxidoreductase [Clostridia bacterium]|nr:SDR family oxidoreductase [Clostridia bacterium]
MTDTSLGYKGKVCVVTGASSGMGRATVELLVAMGAKVYTLQRRECDVPGIEQSIATNLSDKDSIDAAFAQLPKHIDCFFGVAGLSGAKTDYMTTFNCDYTANWYITETYLKKRMSAGGSIVYVSSTAGLNWLKYKKEEEKVLKAKTWKKVEKSVAKLAKISPSTFAYMYAKRCISYYAAKQSVELGKLGIRVNNVMPGSTDTGMKDEFEKMAGGEEALLKEAGTAGRLATSEEMAWPIVFLGSPVASFVSGVEFNVDSADTMMKKLKLKRDVEAIPITNKLVIKAAGMAMKKQGRAE